MQTNKTEYKVELANKIVGGRCVGNLWGVGEFVNGCRRGWVLRPQDSEAVARNFAALRQAHAAETVA